MIKGLCPPKNRYALDQVPLEFTDAKQSHNDVGAVECFIRGSKVDLSKRQASLQLTVRAVSPQNVEPAIVFCGEILYSAEKSLQHTCTDIAETMGSHVTKSGSESR